MSNIHTYTPIHWLYFPRSSLSDAMYHIELNNFYDECVRELICFFSAFGLFLFLFVSFFFLFCFALFCSVFFSTSIYFRSHAIPWYATFYSLVSFQKGFFLFPPIIFIWVDYLHSTEKLRCILWDVFFFLEQCAGIFLLFSTRRISNQSQINK